jgi:hypothetical protein
MSTLETSLNKMRSKFGRLDSRVDDIIGANVGNVMLNAPGFRMMGDDQSSRDESGCLTTNLTY